MKRPFKLTPEDPSSVLGSVLLIHGLYATPNQCRKFAEKLKSEGYEVTVPVLAGHGTSAEDLRGTTQRDWCDSVFSSLPEGKFHIIGFSTGGLIAAKVAAELSERVISLSCICTPQKFVHKGMSLAKIARKVNFPKYWDNGDNPETYNKIPVSSVCELQELVLLSKGYFSALVTPTAITQTTKDPIVDPVSGQDILELLTHNNGNLSIIDSNRHDIDSSEESVLEFIGENNE
jgi:esterase/lipase